MTECLSDPVDGATIGSQCLDMLSSWKEDRIVGRRALSIQEEISRKGLSVGRFNALSKADQLNKCACTFKGRFQSFDSDSVEPIRDKNGSLARPSCTALVGACLR